VSDEELMACLRFVEMCRNTGVTLNSIHRLDSGGDRSYVEVTLPGDEGISSWHQGFTEGDAEFWVRATDEIRERWSLDRAARFNP
jgi:hypothetical protein